MADTEGNIGIANSERSSLPRAAWTNFEEAIDPYLASLEDSHSSSKSEEATQSIWSKVRRRFTPDPGDIASSRLAVSSLPPTAPIPVPIPLEPTLPAIDTSIKSRHPETPEQTRQIDRLFFSSRDTGPSHGALVENPFSLDIYLYGDYQFLVNEYMAREGIIDNSRADLRHPNSGIVTTGYDVFNAKLPPGTDLQSYLSSRSSWTGERLAEVNQQLYEVLSRHINRRELPAHTVPSYGQISFLEDGVWLNEWRNYFKSHPELGVSVDDNDTEWNLWLNRLEDLKEEGPRIAPPVNENRNIPTLTHPPVVDLSPSHFTPDRIITPEQANDLRTEIRERFIDENQERLRELVIEYSIFREQPSNNSADLDAFLYQNGYRMSWGAFSVMELPRLLVDSRVTYEHLKFLRDNLTEHDYLNLVHNPLVDRLEYYRNRNELPNIIPGDFFTTSQLVEIGLLKDNTDIIPSGFEELIYSEDEDWIWDTFDNLHAVSHEARPATVSSNTTPDNSPPRIAPAEVPSVDPLIDRIRSEIISRQRSTLTNLTNEFSHYKRKNRDATLEDWLIKMHQKGNWKDFNFYNLPNLLIDARATTQEISNWINLLDTDSGEPEAVIGELYERLRGMSAPVIHPDRMLTLDQMERMGVQMETSTTRSGLFRKTEVKQLPSEFKVITTQADKTWRDNSFQFLDQLIKGEKDVEAEMTPEHALDTLDDWVDRMDDALLSDKRALTKFKEAGEPYLKDKLFAFWNTPYLRGVNAQERERRIASLYESHIGIIFPKLVITSGIGIDHPVFRDLLAHLSPIPSIRVIDPDTGLPELLSEEDLFLNGLENAVRLSSRIT